MSNKFSEFEVAHGGSDRLYYERCIFPMGTYNTAFDFELVTWKYGRLPVVFSGCDFTNCVFDRVDLTYAVFIDCKFLNVTFRRCVLNMATFVDSHGHKLTFQNCEASDLIMMHSMVDGLRYNFSALVNARITVNSEYLAPLVFNQCDLEGAKVANTKQMQYDGLFGMPLLGSKDRVSVKTDRCRGAYEIEGFQYASG